MGLVRKWYSFIFSVWKFFGQGFKICPLIYLFCLGGSLVGLFLDMANNFKTFIAEQVQTKIYILSNFLQTTHTKRLLYMILYKLFLRLTKLGQLWTLLKFT